jgi:hypothetical protein
MGLGVDPAKLAWCGPAAPRRKRIAVVAARGAAAVSAAAHGARPLGL